MRILDVGCGGFSIGDVNCDLFVGSSPHMVFQVDTTKNFVKCDAMHLPFRTNSFTIVHASHVLEHLPKPLDFINEAERVTSKYLYIKVPSLKHVANNICKNREHKTHLYTWSEDSLRNLLSVCFSHVTVIPTHGKRHGTAVIRGKILKKLGLLGKIIGLMLKQFYFTELVAICEIKN